MERDRFSSRGEIFHCCTIPPLGIAVAMATAALPTYKTAAHVLERDKGSGVRLLGWTVARTLLIAPPFMVVGVPAKQAFIGAGIASGLISLFTLLRIFDARQTGLAGLRRPQADRHGRRRLPPRPVRR